MSAKNQLATLEQLWQEMAQLRQGLDTVPLDCATIPEISAAIQSYIAQPLLAQEGIHLFFDIGSGTLEAACFKFWREQGLPRVDFYAGQVAQLGVTAISTKVAPSNKKLSVPEIENAIVNNNTSVLQQLDLRDVRRSIQLHVAAVVYDGRHKKEAARREYKGKFYKYDWIGHASKLDRNLPQPAFLGGGGSYSSFYQEAIISPYEEFQQANAGIPRYNELSVLPKPQNLEMNGIDGNNFHRFAIAYGLSVQDDGEPAVKLPSLFSSAKQDKRARSSQRPGEGPQAIDSEYIDSDRL